MTKKGMKRLALVAAKIVACLALVFLVAFIISYIAIPLNLEGSDLYDGGEVLLDDAGNVLRVTLGEHDVDCRPYYRASSDDWIVKALVASEDGTYWSHCGVRPLSIARATVQNITSGRRISGASTITMQAVRLIHPHPKNMKWKYIEAIKALKLERAKDKCWILSQYLNRAPFGSNFIGIEAAASGWFGKSAKDLGVGEAAMLAGMVQAPSRFRPDRSFDRAIKRREYVLRRMLKLGYITEEQMEGAMSVRPVVCRAPRPFRNPYYCDWAMRHVRRAGVHGEAVTTLNADVQTIVDGVVNEIGAGGKSAAAVVMRADSGAVVALSCSGDYFDKDSGQVNTALAPRPAGSTLKPFLSALAMDRGCVAPSEKLYDIPKSFKGYAPANFDSKYRGLVSLSDSLVMSLNLPFVQMVQRVGVEDLGTSLRGMGFSHMGMSDEAFGLGIAIGNVEVTLVELVAAYGTIARGGIYRHPVAMKSEIPGALGSRIFSAASCHLVSEMLSGKERSAAALGHIMDVDVPRFAWKTGTSSGFRDAWTVAWNPEYVIGVWVGYKRGHFGDESIVGAKAAAPLAWKIVRALYPSGNAPWYVQPSSISTRKVCKVTGLAAGPDCPETDDGSYIKDITPAKLCPVHCRDLDGNPIEKFDSYLAAFTGRIAKTQALAIARPQPDSKLLLESDSLKRVVTFSVNGNVEGEKLWWYLNGISVGNSFGSDTFSLDVPFGKHEVSCVTADGIAAFVKFEVAGE